MPTLNDAFVNALLADASYVTLQNKGDDLLDSADRDIAFASRLTPRSQPT